MLRSFCVLSVAFVTTIHEVVTSACSITRAPTWVPDSVYRIVTVSTTRYLVVIQWLQLTLPATLPVYSPTATHPCLAVWTTPSQLPPTRNEWRLCIPNMLTCQCLFCLYVHAQRYLVLHTGRVSMLLLFYTTALDVTSAPGPLHSALCPSLADPISASYYQQERRRFALPVVVASPVNVANSHMTSH